MRLKPLLSTAVLFGSAVALCASALAQAFKTPAPSGPNVREVSLIRQDFSDCDNGNVSPSGTLGGSVWVVRGSDGTTKVKVGITGTPNTAYHFHLKCVRRLGDIQTYDEGAGAAEFSFNTNEIGNVFAFDVYPEGAPAGNKYQSVQVKY